MGGEDGASPWPTLPSKLPTHPCTYTGTSASPNSISPARLTFSLPLSELFGPDPLQLRFPACSCSIPPGGPLTCR